MKIQNGKFSGSGKLSGGKRLPKAGFVQRRVLGTYASYLMAFVERIFKGDIKTDLRAYENDDNEKYTAREKILMEFNCAVNETPRG